MIIYTKRIYIATVPIPSPTLTWCAKRRATVLWVTCKCIQLNRRLASCMLLHVCVCVDVHINSKYVSILNLDTLALWERSAPKMASAILEEASTVCQCCNISIGRTWTCQLYSYYYIASCLTTMGERWGTTFSSSFSNSNSRDTWHYRSWDVLIAFEC